MSMNRRSGVAVRHRSSFNLVHFGTGLKIDVFVAPDSGYETSVRARRISEPFGDGRGARRLWIASSEDTIPLEATVAVAGCRTCSGTMSRE